MNSQSSAQEALALPCRKLGNHHHFFMPSCTFYKAEACMRMYYRRQKLCASPSAPPEPHRGHIIATMLSLHYLANTFIQEKGKRKLQKPTY